MDPLNKLCAEAITEIERSLGHKHRYRRTTDESLLTVLLSQGVLFGAYDSESLPEMLRQILNLIPGWNGDMDDHWALGSRALHYLEKYGND